MGLREVSIGVGLAAAAFGVGAYLALTVGGCGSSQGTSGGPAAAQGTPTTAQPQLPALDLAAPSEFQTATFSFG